MTRFLLWPDPGHLAKDLRFGLIRTVMRILRSRGRRLSAWGRSSFNRLLNGRARCDRDRRCPRLWSRGTILCDLLRRTIHRLRGSLARGRRGLGGLAGFESGNDHLSGRSHTDRRNVLLQTFVHGTTLIAARRDADQSGRGRDQASWLKRSHEALRCETSSVDVRHRRA